MRVTVVGHSCLKIETSAGLILVDPWLLGSCFWRSWWHFPPSEPPDDGTLKPDFVYLTHHHFDHFHYPSLRRIDRSAQVLIPRFGVDAMAAEVTGIGFAAPVEMPHSKIIDLGHGVRVASFQYGFDDSVFAVADGDDVLVDLNDAKTRGRALAQIVKCFGRPALAFKSHSFAQSYPVLYRADDPDDLTMVTRDTYLDDFFETMQQLRPRYAIPFGSMVAFLHPESRPVNDHLITPGEVKSAMGARGCGVEVVTMAPGDSWCSERGFTRSSFDWYAQRRRHLEALAAEVAPKLARQESDEQGRTLHWSQFEAYFGGFVRAVPRVAGRRLVPRRIVFRVPSDTASPFWWISVTSREVGRAAAAPADRAGVIHVSEAVMDDAIERRIFHMIHGSMRIRADLAAGGAHSDLAFWGLLMVWELGYLPLRRQLMRPRMWAAAARRHRELSSQLAALLSPQPVAKLARRFGATPTASSPKPPGGIDSTDRASLR